MKKGDRVTGIPEGELAQEKFPGTVTGTYDETTFTFAGKSDTIRYVVFDGVHVPCRDIRPAGRREKVTTL